MFLFEDKVPQHSLTIKLKYTLVCRLNAASDPDEMCKLVHELNTARPCDIFQRYGIEICERALKRLSQLSPEVSII
jgi:hypothetical protein